MVVKNKVVRFPRTLKSVTDIIERISFRIKETPVDTIIVLARRKDGGMIVVHNRCGYHKLLGMMTDGADILKDGFGRDDD